MSVKLLFVILFYGISVGCDAYNRSELEAKYPELEKDFVFFPDENVEGALTVGYLTHTEESRIFGIGDADVEKDVTFTFYSKGQPKGINFKKFKDLPKYFDNRRESKFITHGWMSNGNSDSCITIMTGFINTSNVNVIIMDWSPISQNKFYPVPMLETSNVASHYSKFLNYLVNEKDVDPKDIHLIGHSLGAHISGFAGRGLKNGKVARITGLDPALPGFWLSLFKGGRLNNNDAEFVDVIHTCAGFLGIKDPIGDVDFYPNGGGPPQPGCNILELTEACSHGRSFRLFAESIFLEKAYMATKCDSFQLLLDEKCDGDEIPMGLSTPVNAKGIYYLKTGDKPLVTGLFKSDINFY